MAELTVHWTRPQDTAAFERDYIQNHLPLTRQWVELVSTQFSRTTDPTAASDPVAYTFRAQFPSQAALEAALQSPSTQRIQDDAQRLERTYQCTSRLLILSDPIEAATIEKV
jgi:uncharacterized protein (TIGR02118 family)